ncbi:hypothetical protein BJ170DRAFT_600164 [Xylariales sp. AK1849]|nr:hypothetical protein BJ170DRAFT_600164 [Xylariales sp. AK1849]
MAKIVLPLHVQLDRAIAENKLLKRDKERSLECLSLKAKLSRHETLPKAATRFTEATSTASWESQSKAYLRATISSRSRSDPASSAPTRLTGRKIFAAAGRRYTCVDGKLVTIDPTLDCHGRPRYQQVTQSSASKQKPAIFRPFDWYESEVQRSRWEMGRNHSWDHYGDKEAINETNRPISDPEAPRDSLQSRSGLDEDEWVAGPEGDMNHSTRQLGSTGLVFGSTSREDHEMWDSYGESFAGVSAEKSVTTGVCHFGSESGRSGGCGYFLKRAQRLCVVLGDETRAFGIREMRNELRRAAEATLTDNQSLELLAALPFAYPWKMHHEQVFLRVNREYESERRKYPPWVIRAAEEWATHRREAGQFPEDYALKTTN